MIGDIQNYDVKQVLPLAVRGATYRGPDFDMSHYLGPAKAILAAEAQGSGITLNVKFQASDPAALGGSYNETGDAGAPAALMASRRLAAEGSAYILSGSSAGLHRGMRVSAGVGAFALTGLAASLRHLRVLPAGPGVYMLAGRDASLRHLRVLPAGPGVYMLAGRDASLIYTPLEAYKLLRVTFGPMKKPGLTGSLRSARILISHRSASIGADGLQ